MPGLPVLVDLGTLGGDQSWAEDVNDRGQVVGCSHAPSGEMHAFLWEEGRMRGLGTPAGHDSHAWAVNEYGWVVGYCDDQHGHRHACLWRDAGPQLLPSPRDCHSVEARAVNDRGQVVGYGEGLLDAKRRRMMRALLWENGRLRDLTAGDPRGESTPLESAVSINDRGQIVGQAADGVFLWERGRAHPIRGGYQGAWYINALGQALLSKGPPACRWVVWRGGREYELYRGDDGPQATNDRGVAVASMDDGATLFHGRTYLNLNRIRWRGPRMHLERATAINNRGQIVGNGIMNGKEHAFLLSGVLEAQPPPGGNPWP